MYWYVRASPKFIKSLHACKYQHMQNYAGEQNRAKTRVCTYKWGLCTVHHVQERLFHGERFWLFTNTRPFKCWRPLQDSVSLEKPISTDRKNSVHVQHSTVYATVHLYIFYRETDSEFLHSSNSLVMTRVGCKRIHAGSHDVAVQPILLSRKMHNTPPTYCLQLCVFLKLMACSEKH